MGLRASNLAATIPVLLGLLLKVNLLVLLVLFHLISQDLVDALFLGILLQKSTILFLNRLKLGQILLHVSFHLIGKLILKEIVQVLSHIILRKDDLQIAEGIVIQGINSTALWALKLTT